MIILGAAFAIKYIGILELKLPKVSGLTIFGLVVTTKNVRP